MMSRTKNRAIVIVGATGVGKTKLSIELAKAINGEVVNADAMQMYKGLDIATAKASQEEMKGIKHHLLGFLAPEKAITVREFRDKAVPLIDEITTRGKSPIVVGGTLYYIQALIWPSLIDEVENRPTTSGFCETVSKPNSCTAPAKKLDYTYERLIQVDKEMASKLHPNDKRKIKRSLEIFEETGEKNSELLKRQKAVSSQTKLDCLIFWLGCEQRIYEQRLRKRVEEMMQKGLLEEARTYYRDFDNSKNSIGMNQSIGYKEFAPYFDAVLADKETPVTSGSRSLELLQHCKERLIIHHRQYAKRQLKWISHKLLTKNVPVIYMDTSDIDSWNKDVLCPCVDLADKFLKLSSEKVELGRLPKEFKTVNKLEDATKYGREKLERFICEVCDSLVILGKEQYEKHLKQRVESIDITCAGCELPGTIKAE